MRRAMWQDIEMLEVLHAHEVDGVTMTEIARQIDRPKNSVIGMVNRVRNETNLSDPDGNQNGTLKPKWWQR